ncbi:MAG: Crp/Fnr family transcriptional regulator [Solirubrobacterales bacterium]|nr:Crp/Fnr family transcriptional regulator [Solirubrobacterales bacterium]
MTSETTLDTAELLGSTRLFSTLPEDALRHIAAVAVPRAFPSGTAIFHVGDPGEACYVIRSGHARAIGEHPDGRQITLGNFGPGDIFGEFSLFDAETRSATVEALDDVETLAILGSDLKAQVVANPELGLALASALARRLRIANQRIERRSFQTVQGRVAAAIRELVDRARAEGAGPGPTKIVATQAEIAQLAGTSRESASRFLAELSRAGVVQQGRGRMVVIDPPALEGWVW